MRWNTAGVYCREEKPDRKSLTGFKESNGWKREVGGEGLHVWSMREWKGERQIVERGRDPIKRVGLFLLKIK